MSRIRLWGHTIVVSTAAKPGKLVVCFLKRRVRMAEFIPWNSKPLDEWTKRYAAGTFIELDGHSTPRAYH